MSAYVKFILDVLVAIAAIFGITIVITWSIGHFFCPSLIISVGDIGAALGGVAAIVGLYSAIQSYFESKSKQRENIHIGKTINFLIRLRNFVDALYSATSQFGQNGDPEQAPDQDYPEHMRNLRNIRFKEYADLLKEIEKDSKEVDAFFNEEIINLFTDIDNKWREINLNFRMWSSTFQIQGLTIENGNYWALSRLSAEDYELLRGRITQIIRDINPNYSKRSSDISFI